MGRQKSRIYTRDQGGSNRFYADFRDFRDVGGRREALIPKGAHRATTDEMLAQALAAERLEELEAKRRRRQRGQPLEDATLITYAARHLMLKKEGGQVGDQWLASVQLHLEAAIQFFCNQGSTLPKDDSGHAILSGLDDRSLSSISSTDVAEYLRWLAQRPNGRGGTLSPSSQLKYLNSLSNLFRRAMGEKVLEVPVNPVSGLLEKPREGAGRRDARWMEVGDAAAYLEAARAHSQQVDGKGITFAYEIVATFLLTGGRKAEVLGLTVGDVSLERSLVRFRPNRWRDLKTKRSNRSMPLWPQLREILEPYIKDREKDRAELLFPSARSEGMITDLRKTLDAISTRVGWEAGFVRTYAFRHTYASARLQTLDNGAPVSPFTVAHELGHGGDSLVKRVYGHLGEVRQRSAVVEYRPHSEKPTNSSNR